MKEIRVGIIGAGTISHRHMNVYTHIQQHAAQLGFTAKVVACAEIIPERLKAWGAKYGISEENLYTDFRQMLLRDDIDTIDVCTFHNLHTPLSVLAMKAGKDVYCEKPSAASYRDAKLAIDAAAALGRKFQIQLSTLMTPQTRKARKMIREGQLGDIYYANLEFISRRRRPGYDVPFSTDFYSKRMSGHGQGLDGGSYLIGQMLYLLGLPKLQSVNGFACQGIPVKPQLVTNPDGFGVEDLCDGFAKFEGGIGFHYTMTSALNYKDYSMTYIAGSKAGLELTMQDMGGGDFAKPLNAPPGGFSWKPELKFYGELDGQDIDADLKCVENGRVEMMEKPEMLLYNDNQVHWLAYKLGILSEEQRYNTPAILAEQLLVTDGIFLSNELGRSVSRDEIIEMSPSFNILEQEIDGKTVHYDLSF